MPVLYGPLLGALGTDGWDSRVFAYDWRKHMQNSRVAKRLKDCISETYNRTGKAVQIITHSRLKTRGWPRHSPTEATIPGVKRRSTPLLPARLISTTRRLSSSARIRFDRLPAACKSKTVS